jgi:hypothetical protein
MVALMCLIFDVSDFLVSSRIGLDVPAIIWAHQMSIVPASPKVESRSVCVL